MTQSATKMTFHVESHRIDAHGSLSRCKNVGFHAQTHENFRMASAELENLHEGDFLGDISKFSAYRWS